MKKDAKPILGFDLDGVIIDHTKNLIRLCHEFGFNIEPWQTVGYRLRKIIGEENYLKIRQILYGIATKNSTPMVGVTDCLSRLKINGYQLYIISARHRENQPIAQQWLNRYLAKIFNKQEIFFVEEESKKNRVCQKLKVDVYLDDKVDVLKNLNVLKLYLFDRYNIRNDFDLGNIQPVSSWQEFYEVVKNFKAEP
jgi:uncharacterized HAD superfamily protein